MKRLARVLALLAALAVVAGAAAAWLARPATPDAFYDPPAEVPGEPGRLLRQQPFDRALPAGARAWRILYTTTDAAGAPAVASAIVMTARGGPDGPRPVIAWTHGTTGVEPGCAPSLLADPFANVPALGPLLERGWIYVATDYVGQGTRGPHPYLIGEGEARSALDAVRAARRMAGLHADARTVVWGHSQGGHAALWTGIVAPSYAPDVAISGIAAAAPASDLRTLIAAIHAAPIGRILTAYVLRAYASAYPDVVPDRYVTGPLARWAARGLAGRCLDGARALVSVAQALVVGGSLFDAAPDDGPLGARLAQNTPDGPLPQPVLVAQGLADELVLPDVQARWVDRRCAAGQAIDFRRYAGLDHLTLVAPDSPFGADLVRWTGARLAGEATGTACAGSSVAVPASR